MILAAKPSGSAPHRHPFTLFLGMKGGKKNPNKLRLVTFIYYPPPQFNVQNSLKIKHLDSLHQRGHLFETSLEE